MKENSHLSYQGQRYCIYAQEYGDYLLIRSYLSTYSLYATLESTLLFFICATVTVICIIQCLRWFLDWKVVRNLRRFNYALEQNEDGRLEDIALNTGITEFDELQFHLNCMMENIQHIQYEKQKKAHMDVYANYFDRMHLDINYTPDNELA